MTQDQFKCSGCSTKIMDFSINYQGRKILNNLNFEIHYGEFVALVGPNGAGKTSFFRALLGEIPFSGQIKFVCSKSHKPKVPKIGYVPQNVEIDKGSPVTVSDFFDLIGNSKASTQFLLNLVEASHLFHRRLGELSRGELQRIFLAFSLTPTPDILLFDEPVSGVDAKGTDLFFQLARKLSHEFDISIILVSHDLKMVKQYSDRVIQLQEGIISEGRPEEVLHV